MGSELTVSAESFVCASDLPPEAATYCETILPEFQKAYRDHLDTVAAESFEKYQALNLLVLKPTILVDNAGDIVGGGGGARYQASTTLQETESDDILQRLRSPFEIATFFGGSGVDTNFTAPARRTEISFEVLYHRPKEKPTAEPMLAPQRVAVHLADGARHAETNNVLTGSENTRPLSKTESGRDPIEVFRGDNIVTLRASFKRAVGKQIDIFTDVRLRAIIRRDGTLAAFTIQSISTPDQGGSDDARTAWVDHLYQATARVVSSDINLRPFDDIAEIDGDRYYLDFEVSFGPEG